jgi:hypothetical protein
MPRVKQDLSFETGEIYYYPNETPVLNVSSALQGSLALKIADKEDGRVVFSKSYDVNPGDARLEIKGISPLKEGIYSVTGTLKSKSGKSVSENAWFGVVKKAVWPRVDIKKVSLGAEGTILVNGEPFFPVEMYHTVEGDYPYIAELGFNGVGTGWRNTAEELIKQLDSCKASGLVSNMGLTDPGYGDRLGKRENVKARVEGTKHHPAILMYHLLDEPAVSYYPTLEKGYNYVKELDPNRLQFCTLPNFLGYPDSTMDAAAATRDIIAPDVYPFDCYPVTAVAEGVKMCAEAAKRAGWNKTVLYVGPCFEWLPVYRMPTPDELRLVAYLSVISGAKGLSWYSYREPGLEEKGTGYGLHIPAASRIRSVFKLLNSEISCIYPAVCAPTPKEQFAASSEGRMDVVLKEGKDAYYLLAANPEAKSKKVTLKQNGMSIPDGEVTVMSEYRTLKMKKSTIEDTFEPYAVHIYTIKKR